MAVNLSFIGGAGWQFLDNNADPLSGGKIYTYAAGTTTPQVTFTSRTGLTANTNPIILDSAGRTPQQIWSTEGLLYKYEIKTSTDVLIRSWDNIGGSIVASDLAQDLANTTDNTKGDALVGFKQSNSSGFATNAVARTVNTKLQEFVSVKDFGAIGDGVADDFLALNRAAAYISSIGGGTVFYPAGTYRITRSIRLDDFDVDTNTYSGNVRNNMVHQGAGRDATIILADGFYACIFTSFPEPWIPSGFISPSPVPGNVMASNVVIQDMTLDCNYDNVVDGGAAYGANYQTSPPALSGWPNGYVGASYWAADNYQYPIMFYYSEGLQVTNCRVINSWYNGIEIYASARVQINDNFIDHCGDKANFLGYYAGIQFDQRSNTISCTDNIIQNCGNGVLSVSGSGATSPVSDVVLADNIFYNIGPGNGVYATDFVQRWSVTGNIFDTLENQGIVFTNNQPVWPATDLPKDILIANNTIKEFSLGNGVGNAGIRAVGHNFTISGNYIGQTNGGVTNNTFGIIVSDSIVTVAANESKGMSIVGNTIAGKFPGADASIGMIYVDVQNATVSGNTIKSTASLAQTAVTLFSSNAVVTGNNIVGLFVESTRAIYRWPGSTNMFIQDNRFSPLTAFHTTIASGAIGGSTNVDFSALSTIVDVDNRGNYDSANDGFSPDIPGIYEFTAVVRITTSAAVLTQALIQANNVTTIANGAVTSSAGGTVTISLIGFYTSTLPDVIRLRVNTPAGTYVVESFTSLSAKFIRQVS